MKKNKLAFIFLIVVTFYSTVLLAQSDPFAVANSSIGNYYASASKLMYALGGLSGLVAAYKVYIKIQKGEGGWDAVAGWLGGCIFLVFVGSVLSGFGLA